MEGWFQTGIPASSVHCEFGDAGEHLTGKGIIDVHHDDACRRAMGENLRQ
jgi:hypothetical protein